VIALALAALALSSPVGRWVDPHFGPILTTPSHQALYTWTAERDFKIHCTGVCAKAWPPLVVKHAPATRVAGIAGIFGTIRRPDGRLQLTFNRRPVYSYGDERPEQVRCNNVNGWFVVRLK